MPVCSLLTRTSQRTRPQQSLVAAQNCQGYFTHQPQNTRCVRRGCVHRQFVIYACPFAPRNSILATPQTRPPGQPHLTHAAATHALRRHHLQTKTPHHKHTKQCQGTGTHIQHGDSQHSNQSLQDAAAALWPAGTRGRISWTTMHYGTAIHLRPTIQPPTGSCSPRKGGRPAPCARLMLICPRHPLP
jgi:hypothetical protein